MRFRTVIAIVHHLLTIKDFDRIVVRDHGRIARGCSPKILTPKKDFYSKMMKASMSLAAA